MKLRISNTDFDVKTAISGRDKALGLAGVVSIPGQSGMLFVFRQDSPQIFTTAGMKFPLDFVWIDSNKRVVGLSENVDANSGIVIAPQPCQYVLEINGGAAKEFGIRDGAAVEFELVKQLEDFQNWVQKDRGFKHKHDNLPVHPIGVKDHQKYFSGSFSEQIGDFIGVHNVSFARTSKTPYLADRLRRARQSIRQKGLEQHITYYDVELSRPPSVYTAPLDCFKAWYGETISEIDAKTLVFALLDSDLVAKSTFGDMHYGKRYGDPRKWAESRHPLAHWTDVDLRAKDNSAVDWEIATSAWIPPENLLFAEDILTDDLLAKGGAQDIGKRFYDSEKLAFVVKQRFSTMLKKSSDAYFISWWSPDIDSDEGIFIRKQDGSSSGVGAVATSSNPGVFTPTYGGDDKKQSPGLRRLFRWLDKALSQQQQVEDEADTIVDDSEESAPVDKLLAQTIQASDVPLSTKALILNSDGKLLVLRGAYSEYWDLPGGHVDSNETVEESLVREIREEIGRNVEDARRVNWPEPVTIGKDGHSVVFFLTTIDDGDIKLSEEHTDIKWITRDDIPNLNLGVFSEIIAACLDSESAPVSIVKARAGLVPKRVPVIQQRTGRRFEAIRWVRPEEGTKATPSGVRIPPNWTDVWVSANPKTSLQAVGTDSKGRRQYLYSVEHSQQAAASKFKRISDFVKAAPHIVQYLRQNVHSREEALVLYLIYKTGFRIGSDKDTGAKQKAYGVSTLEGQHVKVLGNKIVFDFVGKKGVRNQKTITDFILAACLRDRVQRGANSRLFDVNEAAALKYLHEISGKPFLVKDFRTMLGTSTALKEMQSLPLPENPTQFKKQRKMVAIKVAQELGNTPAVALKAYIAPEVFSPWLARVEPMMQKSDDIDDMQMLEDFLSRIQYLGDTPDWENIPETGEDEEDSFDDMCECRDENGVCRCDGECLCHDITEDDNAHLNDAIQKGLVDFLGWE